MSADYIGQLFRKYLTDSGIKQKGLSCHSIRHSIATILLEKGVGLRYVQELLGHESIETTVIYTHTLYESLKRTYKSHHPRENKYYCEVDDAYLDKIMLFKSQLQKQKQTCERDRQAKLRYQQKKLK